jgi:cyclopropane fatty-acyl-phospholipid synthase-like methyltransferase
MTTSQIQRWRQENRFLNWLRGDYRSLKMRFLKVPMDYVDYVWGKAFGKSYTEVYAKRMDAEARISAYKTIPTVYLNNAEGHRNFLINHGLNPNHRVLDYGAGVLRTGQYLLKYLDANRYVAADISGERLAKGQRLAEANGIPKDSYRVQVISDCHIRELEGEKFDLIWSHDVVPHLPLAECELMFRSLRGLLSESGRIFLTYSHADKPRRIKFKDFWFTEKQMRTVSEAAGLNFEIQEDWKDYRPESSEDNILVCLTPA